MPLYAAPRACSFAAHVLIRELDLPIDVRLVRLGPGETAIHAVNPVGRVPALVLDDGTLITENTAILPYLADLRPGTSLFAPAGSAERAQIQAWIGYVNSEIHAGALRAFNRPERYTTDPAAQASVKQAALKLLAGALAPIEAHLAQNAYLVGNRLTIADIYLGVFAGIGQLLGESLGALPHLSAFSARFEALASVKAARAVESDEVLA